jgi:hypothetical protein
MVTFEFNDHCPCKERRVHREIKRRHPKKESHVKMEAEIPAPVK